MSQASGLQQGDSTGSGTDTDTMAMEHRPAPDKTVRPIIIIGAPRSGTSITTWALGQHPNIQPMPETGWIASLAVGSYLSYLKGSERGKFSHLSNVGYPAGPFMARIGEAADAIVRDVFDARCEQFYAGRASTSQWQLSAAQLRNPMHLRRSAADPKQRWIDGTPLNSFYIWALAEMFPQAQFIHNLRRPDEVATSLEGFDRVGAEPQALDAGLQTWIEHTENAWYAERGLGSGRVFRLDFHRLADDPETLLRELCGFLGEPFNADCLLPLSRRLNSSQVAEKRRHNLALLRGNPAFERAEAVYDLVSRQPGTTQPDAFSLSVIEQRFLDYCRDRAIV